MKKQLKYDVNLEGLKVLKTKDEQFDDFFYSGHPEFLIPDFNSEPCDIWLSLLDFIEAEKGIEIYDQNGGEVIENEIIDAETGLTKCKYQAFEIQEDEDDDFTDYIVDILGYVVSKDNRTYFLVTEANISTHASF